MTEKPEGQEDQLCRGKLETAERDHQIGHDVEPEDRGVPRKAEAKRVVVAIREQEIQYVPTHEG